MTASSIKRQPENGTAPRQPKTCFQAASPNRFPPPRQPETTNIIKRKTMSRKTIMLANPRGFCAGV
ncbi:hypothetical protein, partial [Kingella oralis]